MIVIVFDICLITLHIFIAIDFMGGGAGQTIIGREGKVQSIIIIY